MWSDNGTNCVGAEQELREARSSLNQEWIKGILLQDGIHWSLNTPAASHNGVVWSGKSSHLFCICKLWMMMDCTLSCRSGGNIKQSPQRPWTAQSQPYSPYETHASFTTWTLCKGGSVHQEEMEASSVHCRAVLKKMGRGVPSLASRTAKVEPSKKKFLTWKYCCGDPRGSWLLGRVLETFLDEDNLVRSIHLQTKTSVLERPITKLCL